MTITEQSRLNLYDSVRTHHGEEVAVTLMEMLPPVGWADIATKDDLEQVRLETTMEFEKLRLETKMEFDDVRHHIEMLRIQTSTDTEILRKTIDSKMNEMFGRQLKWTVGTMIAMQACTFGLLKMV